MGAILPVLCTRNAYVHQEDELTPRNEWGILLVNANRRVNRREQSGGIYIGPYDTRSICIVSISKFDECCFPSVSIAIFTCHLHLVFNSFVLV